MLKKYISIQASIFWFALSVLKILKHILQLHIIVLYVAFYNANL
jgi:hypothetical protein